MSASEDRSAGTRMLKIAALAFGAGVTAHTLDHFRQERGLEATPTDVVIGGSVLAIAAAITIALVLADHPKAARAAAIMGIVQTLAVTKAHFMPNAGPGSDSYYGLGVDTLSWIAAAAEVAGAILMASVALAVLRARRSGTTTPVSAGSG